MNTRKKKQKSKMVEMSDEQANAIACAALRNLLASFASIEETPESKSLVAMLDRALIDGRPNATFAALCLILASAGAWEATRMADGLPSSVQQFDELREQTGGGGVQ